MVDLITAHVLDQIPFEPDLPWLMKRLRIKEGSANQAELVRVLEEARPIAHPRAFYLVAYTEGKGEDWMNIGGNRFSSRVLRVNFEKQHRVFPFLATCGPELQAFSDQYDDMLLNFWAEAVKEAALFCAIRAMNEDLDRRYRPGKTASMSPGSLPDWPIEEQVPLFHLFGDYPEAIGVKLTDSLLMMPTKTVSGIRFSTETEFASCQLCPREGCPGRSAVYDPDLYDSRYCRQNGLMPDKIE